jgi:16S rRNA (guanine1207-N2)-methyltransferase
VARRIAPGRLILSDIHSAALARAAETLQHNGLAGYEVLPADRLDELGEGSLTRALVNSAFQSSAKALNEALDAIGYGLRPGGMLYVAGAKARGIGAIKAQMAELFGASATLGYRKGVHVIVATRQTETWAARSADRPLETVEVIVRGHTFQLALREGVFARGGLDEGTRMLLEALEVRPADLALDLGCGGGIIGMLLARLAPEGHVDLVDSNMAAVGLARANLALNGIANAAVHLGDGIAALSHVKFDLIATNPPFHLGRRQTMDVARQFIADAAGALRPGGRFYLVANRFLPYERAITDAFENVREVVGDGRYKVLVGIR